MEFTFGILVQLNRKNSVRTPSNDFQLKRLHSMVFYHFISDVMIFEQTNFDQGTPHRFHDSCIAIKEALRLQNKRNLEDKL